MKYPTYRGVLKWDKANDVIHVTRSMNPPTHHARFLSKLRKEYPNFTIVEDWKNE